MAEKLNQNENTEKNQNEWIYQYQARKVKKMNAAYFNGHIVTY